MKFKLFMASLLAIAPIAPAYADNYNFTFRDTNGNLISSGSLSTGSTVNTIFGGAYQAKTITTMNGLFMGDAINFVPNPYAPAAFQHSYIIADNQLIISRPFSLEGYGLVFDTAHYNTVNLLGLEGYDVDGGDYLAIHEDDAGTQNSTYGTFEVARTADNTTLPGGTETAPVELSSQVTGIAGSIGPTNPDQFYSFDWGGGFFSSTATIGNAAASDQFGFSLVSSYSTAPFARQMVTLDNSNNFTGTLSFNLAAGHYVLGLTGLVPIDPDFTISFNSAVGPAAPVPEPTSWVMTIAGFLGIGAALRRRRVLGRVVAA